jgi:N-acetylmuramic acid 6-phosphate etherase
MTNVKPSNEKLKDRSLRILMAETGLDRSTADEMLNNAGGDLRVALVMQKASISRDAAESALRDANFAVAKALGYLSVPEGD